MSTRQKLKYIIKEPLKYGSNSLAESENKKFPRYIRITDFSENGILRDDTFKSLEIEKAKDFILNEGDILFARSGATVGKTFQFKNYKGQACFAGYLIKAVPNKKIVISDYLYLFTLSHLYESWKNSIFTQATIQNISADKYKELLISIPTIKEQTIITKYLKKKLEESNSLISKERKIIKKLNQAKQSLINEVVTGKIEVI